MGLRTFQRELEEKIKKDKEESGLCAIIAEMSRKLDLLRSDVSDLKTREVVISVDDPQKEKTEQKTNKSSTFIPSVSIDNLKINAGQIEKRKREIDIDGVVDSLNNLGNE